jgi:RsiW-degrading membrane proteinase PrsW (M82 family)
MTIADAAPSDTGWRSPARLLLIGLSVPFGAATLLGFLLGTTFEPAAGALTWTLLIATALVPLLLIRWLARLPPLPVVLAALAWGGLVAPPLATVGVGLWGGFFAAVLAGEASAPWSMAIAAGPIEEAYKLLGVAAIALAFPGRARGVIGGCVVGMLIGLAFETVENAAYLSAFAMGGLSADGPIASVLSGYPFRAVVGGLYAHVALTGLAGAALGWAMERPSARRAAGLALAFVGVACTHAFFNAEVLLPPDQPWTGDDVPALLLVTAVRSLPFVLLVAVLVLGRRSRDAISSGGLTGSSA